MKVTDISGVRVTPLWLDTLLGVTLNALIVLTKLVRIGQYNKFIKIHLAIGYDYLESVLGDSTVQNYRRRVPKHDTNFTRIRFHYGLSTSKVDSKKCHTERERPKLETTSKVDRSVRFVNVEGGFQKVPHRA